VRAFAGSDLIFVNKARAVAAIVAASIQSEKHMDTDRLSH
jgi:hypothetical protein